MAFYVASNPLAILELKDENRYITTNVKLRLIKQGRVQSFLKHKC